MAMRQFIHHPVNIPIDVSIDCHHAGGLASQSSSFGVGGLAFLTEQEISPGTLVKIRISCRQPDFITEAKVVWCHECQHGSELGIEFLTADDAFQLRMFEQICHIENYRLEISRNEGRALTVEEAAIEWVTKYSADFPNPGTEPIH
jgi:hypothetical protein